MSRKGERIQLSDHFNYGNLIRFTLPSIGSMIFTSVYGVVDGYFVSNYVGKIPFAGLNIIMPFIMMIGALGNMIGIGGSALVGMTLGEGHHERANRMFSFLIYFMTGVGIIMSIIGYFLMPSVSQLLGAEGEVLENAVIYGRINMIGLTFFSLQFTFQGFLITAEQPKLNFYITIAAGVTNMVLDALFVGLFRWGIRGAAMATVLSQIVGSVIPFILFILPKNKWILKLGKTSFMGRTLVKACTNGSSEFLSSISMSVVGMLYNTQLLKYAGNDGVAAYGVIMYVTMIFIAIFIGFSMGISPLISFQYGAGNSTELKNLFKKGVTIIVTVSLVMLGLAELLAKPLALIFTSYDEGLLQMTTRAFYIYSISFLFCGMGIFSSSLFTALNNGLISAIISFVRTVILQLLFVFLLPLLFGLDGIWWSVAFAEGVSMMISIAFIVAKRKKYRYV